MDPIVAAWLGFGFWIVLVPLVAAARYWMRRYQLSRTRWRGIRMGLAGSAWGFAAASWGWWVLQVLSLGWYTPAARMNRARLMWNNTRFGDQPFEFIDDGRVPAGRSVGTVRARLVFVSDRLPGIDLRRDHGVREPRSSLVCSHLARRLTTILHQPPES